MKDFKTVLTTSQDEIVIEKSKFIGYSFNINTSEEAEKIIKSIRKQNYDATHNSYAYALNYDMSIVKSSDDGEPSSTAGKPMVDILRNKNITNTLIIATRYFGGIKLGVGGLVRAYTKSAQIAIESNTIVEKKWMKKLDVIINYNNIGKIQNYISNRNVLSSAPEFLENVKFSFYERNNKIEELKREVIDITNADCKFIDKEQLYIDFIDDKAVNI